MTKLFQWKSFILEYNNHASWDYSKASLFSHSIIWSPNCRIFLTFNKLNLKLQSLIFFLLFFYYIFVFGNIFLTIDKSTSHPTQAMPRWTIIGERSPRSVPLVVSITSSLLILKKAKPKFRCSCENWTFKIWPKSKADMLGRRSSGMKKNGQAYLGALHRKYISTSTQTLYCLDTRLILSKGL